MNIQQKKQASSLPRINAIEFNSNCQELTRTWSSFASRVFSINVDDNGISITTHPLNASVDAESLDANVMNGKKSALPNQFHLRTKETKDYQLPTGRISHYRENSISGVEKYLARLRDNGELCSSVFYFGTAEDPFSSLDKKFDLTVPCFELLERYRPQLIVVQTRSPMVIALLPSLKMLGDRAVVCIPIETRLESAIARYTPGEPKIADRLMAANGLRIQGVRVNLMASPILPYGDFYRDAWNFAELLDRHADYITFGCLASGRPSDEIQLRNLSISRKLAADGNYRWLRPYAYKHLFSAVKVLSPKKILLPVNANKRGVQMDLFAA